MRAALRVFHFVSYLTFRLSEGLIRLVSLDCAFVLGQVGGELAYHILRRRRALALRNLRLAFGSEMSDSQLCALNRRHFQLLGANLFAGFSALAASRLAARFGLIKTMVYTHLPSNILLIVVPLMPNLPLAVLALLLRFSISQMDVPTRQSYTMAIVRPEERSSAAGITGVARTAGAALAPVLAGLLFARPSLINLPFFIAGTLKITYDLLLYRAFVRLQPTEHS